MRNTRTVTFTMDELALIAAAGHRERSYALNSIVSGIHFAEGEEASRVAKSTAAKLMSITDEAFSELDFSVLEDFK